MKTDGDFEIRSYPELGLATTADNKDGFNNLFDYISGDNDRSQKIDMTTPVFSTEDGMAFVMQSSVGLDMPEPTNDDVNTEVWPAGRYATKSYSGWSNHAKEQENLTELQNWLATNDM